MARAEIKCIGPSYALADRKSAVQRSINLYMRQVEGLGEDRQVVLDSAPGYQELVFAASQLTAGVPIRGMRDVEGDWYIVSGNQLFVIGTYADGTFWNAPLGTLQTSSGFVSITHGQNFVVLVDGENCYTFHRTLYAFARNTSAGWRGSDWVDFLDGYFIFVDPQTEQFYISAIDDATSINPLDFSSADTNPDDIITHRVFKRELFLFGRQTTEVWVNSGDAAFPLVRYGSTPIEVGIVGKRAVCICADSLMWVGRTGRGAGYVYQMSGHQPVRISTQAVEEAIQQADDMAAIVCWTYHVPGAEFFAISAPGMETTWLYDVATKQWHERGIRVDGAWTPLPIDQVIYTHGDHYALCSDKICRIDKDVFTYDGADLIRERTWPHLAASTMEPVTYRSLELACTTGGGGTITLEVSNDGGYTYGPQLQKSLGVTGRWMERIRWLFLGASRDRVFRLRCSDPVRLTIHGAVVDA